MVLQANAEVLPESYETKRQQVIRDVPPWDLQKLLAYLLLSSSCGKKSKQGCTQDKDSEADGTRGSRIS
jgi:hypothetical protein